MLRCWRKMWTLTGRLRDEKTVIHIGRAGISQRLLMRREDSHNNHIVKYLQDNLNVEYVYDFSVDDSSYNTKVAMAILPPAICPM